MKDIQNKIVKYLTSKGYKASEIIFDKGLPAGLDENYFRLTNEWKELDYESWQYISYDLDISIDSEIINKDDDEDGFFYTLTTKHKSWEELDDNEYAF